MCMWYSVASDACYWCLAECESEHEYISKGNKRDWFWLYEWQLECLWVFMCMYLCMCVCLWQWQGSSRESFHSVFKQRQGSMRRTLQTVAVPGAAGVAERSHTASKKQDSTTGQSIWSKHVPPPSTHRHKKERWGVEGWGDFSVRCSLTLSLVQTREKNWKKLPLQPVMQLKHPAPSPSISPPGSGEPENVPKSYRII